MQSSNENEALSTGEKINSFIQKNRAPIFVAAGVAVVGLLVFIVAFSVMDMLQGKAISAVEDFGSRYAALRASVTETTGAGERANDVAELLTEVEAFARAKSGYAGGRAWAIAGNIHSDKKDWAAAEVAWTAAAKASAKTYLSPIAQFNAGAAAEEQGKTAEAIDYYSKSLAASADFISAPRAQFSIGRLRESLHDNTAAIEAYRTVISGWPNDTVWTNLARSRIIALEATTDTPVTADPADTNAVNAEPAEDEAVID